MYKRHFIFALVCLLSLSAGSRNLSAQSQLAQDTYAIFEGSCLICHGPDGAYRESLLMEHAALIDGGTVVPGNPDASELYKRLLGPTENGAQMPLGQPQLPPQSIETIRQWIVAGAPDWKTVPATDRPFISPAEKLNTIETHLMSLEPFDRAYARYFTLTHLYNAGETAEILQEYRKGLYKLVNSLSWGATIINPIPIDPQATIFYIDLRHYEWDANDGWTRIEEEYPYHIPFDAPEHTALQTQLGRLQTQMKCDIPSVHIDWFVAKASSPPLYHDLLSLPLTERELETRLEVDVVRNLTNAPGVRVWRAGFNNSGVSNNNRVVERHTSRYGAYWKSYDFAGSVGTQNVFTHPLSFTHDGGEAVFNLPNGLQAYYVVNASGFRLDEAPINIVSNPAASDPTVRNGLSCFGCHTEGMKTFEDQVRSVIQSNANPPYNKAQALRLYVEKSDMDARVEKDMEKYRVALEATGGTFAGVEPISRFHEAFQGPVDAAYAAAVVGLQPESFLARVRENTGLQNVGLLALDTENGSVKRDAWTSSFRDVMYALDYPQQVGTPPDITQPDVIPGQHVHISDPILRTLIAEELDKSPNAPITAEEMQGLNRIDAFDKGIRDLTGIQYATNLNRLVIENAQVSDISPIAGLINLRELSFENNPVSDLSPVQGLINLTWLEFDHTKVSDLSPVRGLINLTSLEFHDTLVSDLSPVRGLTSLTYLAFGNTGVSDLSPIAGLINLTSVNVWNCPVTSSLSPFERLVQLEHLRIAASEELSALTPTAPLANLTRLKSLFIGGFRMRDISVFARLTELNRLVLVSSDISDISPLSTLTNLTELELSNNKISELSPLAGLTQLGRLHLAENKISDVSPLAGLTNLKWLGLYHNSISNVRPLASLTNLKWLGLYDNEIVDISPLDGLRKNTTVLWHINPGFPLDAPRIDADWLWVVLPNTQPRSNTDLLSDASGGTVTEKGIATHGATAGHAVGDDVWTSRKLPPTEDWNNVEQMLGGRIDDATIYGTVSLYSPREQQITMYVGSHNEFKVWLNGALIYQSLRYHASFNYTDFLPVTLRPGKNVLLVAVRAQYNSHFGFEAGAEYTVGTGIGYAFSKTPIHIGDTFDVDIRAENVTDLAGWQFDIDFNPEILQAVEVSEGDFLKSDGGATFFRRGGVDNTNGKITGFSAARITSGGASGSGSVLQVRFKAKSEGVTKIALQNFLFGSVTEESIPAAPLEVHITVEERLLTGDVNRDGVVNILDLIRVAQQLGKNVPPNSSADVNGDGVVNILDLTLVAQGIAGAAAPAAGSVNAATIEAWIADARLADDGSIAFRQGIANLESLLATLIPQETALLANYPNPFNPETWIAYQLATPAEVMLTIYGMNGGVVRRLEVGHQAAGMYRSRSRAAYWDGRNGRGESVASGLYFYTLRAGEFAATRKMLIRK